MDIMLAATTPGKALSWVGVQSTACLESSDCVSSEYDVGAFQLLRS